MRSSDLSIEQLQLLRQEDLLDALVHQREDQWLERASSRTTARHVANHLAAFANAEGGLLVIGIHDGRVEGVANAQGLNAWRQAAMDFTQPPVRHRFELVACENARGEPDEIAVIEIEPSERVHVNHKGETYLRVGDETRRLRLLEAQELRYDKGESVYDGTVVDAELSEVEDTLVDEYIAAVRASAATEVALKARGLAGQKDGRLRPTVAGYLLFGSRPQDRLPAASIRLLRYQGASRETGARANVVGDECLDGPLVAQIRGAQEILRDWLPAAFRLEGEGRFSPSTLIPEFVWLEAVVNAVTHRSYSIGGDHVRVELFDDRMEVESPGRLPGLVRLENIRSTRFARNPRVARALNELGYGRELGEGVDRMFEDMNRAGLPDPIYSQGPASVRVTLLADPLAGRILGRLPPGSERFVEYLSTEGRVTTTQAVELLGASRPTVLGFLHDLADQGLIEHVGTSLKDPRGFWRLRRGGER